MKKRILAVIFCIMLIAASAIFLYSCEDNGDKDEADSKGSGKTEENVLGAGATSFKLEITDDKGDTKVYTIKTDEKFLGDALVKVELTVNENGMINTLDGITADFSVDEGWWKLSFKGADSMQGAFDVEIEKDITYSFVYTKGFDMGDWDE